MSEIAREAGALLRSFFTAANFSDLDPSTKPGEGGRVRIEYKGEVDLVTEADRRTEALVVERIRARWPGHDIMGEEGTNTRTGSDFRWYVDPLDGTTNFAHGYPVFCVSLGVERRGELVAGVIYDPTRDELYAAEHGSGARLNGRPVRVSTTPTLAESLLGTGFPSKKRHHNPNIFFYHQLTMRSHGLRRAGSAALDLASVAVGRYDGFWEFHLNPWDTAAGVVLVREAGGMVTDFRGGPFDIASREVCASNGVIHREVLAQFADIFAGRNLAPLPDPAEHLRES